MNSKKAVAVVGMSCRFPGADNNEEYWKLLFNSENHIIEVPDERWNKKHFYSSDRSQPGKSFAVHAGILKEDVRMWDNKPFGINVMEAELMDPQQRLALETTYRALEDGGFTLDDISGTKTSVYMGLMNNDFQSLAYMDPEFMDNYSPTGTTNSILANRLSYFFNVHGSSVSVDTACSSGLVAVHLGSQSILTGESTMAICGGVACILSPTTFIALSKARMASEKGQCQTYTENADGYVRSEGCGMVILKDFEKAMADGDKIWGIVTTASNSDGKSATPITSPSSEMQSRLIESTLQRAGVRPEQIQFVEMHGTGTPVGDPVETSAVGKIIGAARKKSKLPPIPVGSVKTNIGHLEAGAGIAGLMKVLLMMKHKTMVPSVIWGKLKESLNLVENCVEVLQKRRSWETAEINEQAVRIASVNSFGFGGTNVHLVVQSSEGYSQTVLNKAKLLNNSEAPKITLFTGVDNDATKASMEETLKAIKDNPQITLDDVSHTSCNHRTLYPHKVAILAHDLKELEQKLELSTKSESDIGKRVPLKEKRNIVFVFCGMGTHWVGMGSALYGKERAYRDTIDNLHALLQSIGKFDLKKCIEGKYDLSDPKYGQPTIFACQVALFHLWQSKGVVPDVILGHSVGEVAAAYASGRLSLEGAAYVIYHRGRVVSKASDGGMLAVGNLPITDVEQMLKPYSGKLDIAAYNSPQSCTISGALKELDQLHAQLEALNPKPFLRKLKVNVAYHSQFMNPILSELKKVLKARQLKPRLPESKHITQFSTVTGKAAHVSDILTGGYWAQNVRQSVRFSDAMTEAISSDKTNVIIEIGPKPALKTNIKEIAAGKKFELFATMSENKDDLFYLTLVKCYELGAVKRSPGTGILSAVPRYGFQRIMLYKEPDIATNLRNGNHGKQSQGQHPFVVKSTIDDITSCTAKIAPDTTPFVFEHKLNGNIIVPGATYAEMGIAGVSLQSAEDIDFNGQKLISARVHFNQVCFLKTATSKIDLKVACHADPSDKGRYYFDITNGETLHAAGRVSVCDQTKHLPSHFDLSSVTNNHYFNFKENFFYDTLETYGFTYGSSLRCIKEGSTDYKDCLVRLEIPEDTDLKHTFIHTAVLDSMLQGGIMFPAENVQSSGAVGGQILPYGVDEVILYRKLCKNMYLYMKPAKSLEFTWKIDAVLLDPTGVVLAECKGITYGTMGKHLNYDVEQHLFTSSWKQYALQEETGSQNKRKLLVIHESESSASFSAFKTPTTKVVLSKPTIEDISKDETVLLKLLPEDVTSFSAILYLVGLHKNKANIDISGQEMNQEVLESTFTLVQLVKVISKIKQAPPIYAVTKGVYPFLKNQEISKRSALETLVGVSVNALARSVNKEIPSFRMHSVDVSSFAKPEVEILEKIIFEKQDYFEFVVHKGEVFYGTLDCAEHTGDSLGRTIAASSSPVQMFTSKRDEALFLKPAGSTAKAGMTLNCVRVDNGKSFEDIVSTNALELVILDSIGTDCNGQKHHICQLHSACSEVEIQKANTLPWDMFPCKYPTLSHWLSAWHIFSKVESGQSIKICENEVSPIWGIVFKSFAKMFNLRVVSKNEASDNMVLITQSVSEDLLNTIKDTDCLFVISETHALHLSVKLTEKIKQISYACSLLSHDKLSKRIAKFSNWLNKIEKQKLRTTLKYFESEADRISHNLNLSDFTNVTLQKCSKPTFIALEKNGRQINMAAQTPKEVVRPNAGYLIVGGRKGLGWETVKYLIELGAKYIGVVSRSGLDEEKVEEGQQLELKHDCRIIDLRADAIEMSELNEAFQNFQNITRVPIKGIFYGAAVTCDSIIPAMDLDKFLAALAPKVAGVWNTYLLTRTMNLDLFVMYSSITSTFGNAGQTNYGAGNAFKDAVACLRRNECGVGQSICWGALDLGILIDNQQARKKVQLLGLAPMKLSEILTSLDHALVANRPIMAYVRFIWPAWYRYMCAGPEILRTQYASLIQRHCHNLKKAKQGSAHDLKASSKTTKGYVINILKTVAVLGDEDIVLSSSISELGADSQDRQKIYNVMMEDIGFTEEDMKLIEMGEMTLQELIEKTKQIKIKYGKQDDNDAENESTENLKMEKSTEKIVTKAQILPETKPNPAPVLTNVNQKHDERMINKGTLNDPLFIRHAPNDKLSNGLGSNSSVATGKVLTDHTSNNHVSNGYVSNGHLANSHMSNGHLSNGPLSNGYVSNGHMSKSKVSNEMMPDRYVPNGNVLNGLAPKDKISGSHFTEGQIQTKTSKPKHLSSQNGHTPQHTNDLVFTSLPTSSSNHKSNMKFAVSTPDLTGKKKKSGFKYKLSKLFGSKKNLYEFSTQL